MTKDTWKKWNIYTSFYLLEYCVYAWRNHMWPHLDGYPNEDRMRKLFWYYLNYGHTNTYYETH
jgi:hypothetical protein